MGARRSKNGRPLRAEEIGVVGRLPTPKSIDIDDLPRDVADAYREDKTDRRQWNGDADGED